MSCNVVKPNVFKTVIIFGICHAAFRFAYTLTVRSLLWGKDVRDAPHGAN